MVNAALLIWPLASFFLFMKIRPALAIAVTVVGGYLLLPPIRQVKFSFFDPGRYSAIPPLDKDTIIAISALAGALAILRTTESRPGWIPRSKIAILLFAVLIIGTFGTTLSNGDPIAFAWRTVPGISLYDFASMIQQLFFLIVPFLVGRKYMSTPADHRCLLGVLVIAAVIYSLPVLYEVRMSPQLNFMIYGYFPHSFLQHIRDGGWRPVVFLNHGLWLGIFLACASLASFGLCRSIRSDKRIFFFLSGVWLLVILALSKNLGSLIIALVLLPFVIAMPLRLQIFGSTAIAILVIFYPFLRTNDMIPTDTVIALAQQIEPARAASLQTRVNNEEMLLAKANERPLFGWGGWGRSRVYTPGGRDISITDGRWIIILGVGGWVRYIAEMGLLTFAIFILAWRSRKLGSEPYSGALSILLAANLVDLLPNASLTPVTWLMAGALAGRTELISANATASAELTIDADSNLARGGALTYSRSSLESTNQHSYLTQYNRESSTKPAKPKRLSEGPRYTRFAPKPGDRS